MKDLRNEIRNAVLYKINNDIKRVAKDENKYINISWFLSIPRLPFEDVIKYDIISIDSMYVIIVEFRDKRKREFHIEKLDEMTYHEYLVNKIFKQKKLKK